MEFVKYFDLIQYEFSLEELDPERRSNLPKAILCVYSCFDFEGLH